MSAPRLLPVGDQAFSVDFGNWLDAGVAARVHALDRELWRHPPPGLLETVPTCRALLILFDPRVGAEPLQAAVAERLPTTADERPIGRQHDIPVRYGGEDGPDLETVAAASGLKPPDVIAVHAGSEYTALMLGFTPGFAYLAPLPPPLAAVPRRESPRPRVPAGSVAIAAGQTAVYPIASPAGWHLLGRTSLPLFDPSASPPALIAPGDRVRFRPVDELPAHVPAPEPPSDADGALEVVAPGLLTSVQDLGRPGHRRYGVGGSGAMDPVALSAANRLAGNAPDAAGLECVGTGFALRFLETTLFAVTGDLGAVLERPDLGPWPVPIGRAVRARAGNRLRFEERRSGLRAWIAFAGGLEVPVVLGSRSTDIGAAFGGHAGRPLRAGDRLALGRAASAPTLEAWSPSPPADPLVLRIVPGPQDDHFAPESRAAFFDHEWTVDSTSDRVGCRLLGPRLRHAGTGEIVSDGMVPGCVQVPPSGQPIVMGPDGPTTGGYPKIATVIAADVPLLARLVPGESRVRFTSRA